MITQHVIKQEEMISGQNFMYVFPNFVFPKIFFLLIITDLKDILEHIIDNLYCNVQI
jgi:hypothetical protein